MSQESTKPGVFIKTFGCQMNEYDTEKMYALLMDSHTPVQDYDSAEVVIINTCSVREKAENKLYGTLGKLQYLKESRPNLIVGVSGCVAQQEGEQILRRSKTVDFVIGTHNLSLVPSLVRQAQQGAAPTAAVDYRDEWEELPDEFDSYDTRQVPLETAFFSPIRALVAIQRGCNKHCSFCVVPTTRGPQVSRDPEEILKEIRLKARLGAKEVMLLGQTVNSYGLDLKPRYRFEHLIEAIAMVPGIERIRFTSPHPAEVRPSFIELFGKLPALCPHIHLPLQSGSDRVLKLMNRNYRVKRYLEIVDALREKVDDLAITSDIIVGFPTETDAEFEQTLEVVRKVGYSCAFTFKYSQRPHTTAISTFSAEEEVEESVAQARLVELQQLQEGISLQQNQRRMGDVVEILVEGLSKKLSSTVRGRIPQNVPTSVVLPPEDASGESNKQQLPKEGSIVAAQITRATPHSLGAVLLNAEETNNRSIPVTSISSSMSSV